MGTAPTTSSALANGGPLAEGLARLRRAARRYLLLTGAARFAGIALALLAGQLLLDWWLRLAADQRFFVDLLVLLGMFWAGLRTIVPVLTTELRDVTLARLVDRAHPDLHDGVATAIEFARGGLDPTANSPALVEQVLAEVTAAAERIDFLQVLDHEHARARLRRMIAAAVVLLVVAIVWRTAVGTYVQRNWLLRDVPWPQATYLRAAGFDADGVLVAPRGEPLRVVVDNIGRIPRTARLVWRTPDGKTGTQPLTKVAAGGDRVDVTARWEVDFGPLRGPVRFRLIGGDERSAEYLVRAVERPQVVAVRMRVMPPAYTGMPVATYADTTAIELLTRSTLEVEARFNKPVRTAALLGAEGPVGTGTLVEPDAFRWTWTEPRSGPLRFSLRDEHDWSNQRPVRLTIKVVADAPPVVQLELPGVGEFITPQAELEALVQASDTYGLSDVRTWARRNEDPELRLEDEPAPGRREHSARLPISPERLGLGPGDRLAVRAEAADNDPAGANVTEVAPIVVEVLSRQDFLTALAEREQELRQEFERLLSAQRGVNDLLARLIPEMGQSPTPSASQQQQLAGLVRRQAGHAARVLDLAERFDDVLAEMQRNRVSRTADQRRIGDGVVAPLRRLGTERLPEASDALEGLREGVSPDEVGRAVRLEKQVVVEMEAVLANMLEFEGYREAVALLTELIDLQTEVRGHTQTAIEGQLDDILDLDEFELSQDGSADEGTGP